MPLPTDKDDLLARLRMAHRKLAMELTDLTEGDARRPELEGHVSVKDVLAYQIGWGRLLLSWDATETAGGVPVLPAPGFGWNDLSALARSFHDEFKDATLDELLHTFDELVERLGAWIESLSDADLFERGRRAWASDKWPLVKWIQVNTIAPYGSARTKIRRFKRIDDRA